MSSSVTSRTRELEKEGYECVKILGVAGVRTQNSIMLLMSDKKKKNIIPLRLKSFRIEDEVIARLL